MRPVSLPDLVVVVPGIMGSVLERDGRELWNSSLAVFGRHAMRRLKSLDPLVLPCGIGDEAADDGVLATKLLSGLHLFPGLSAIDGYRGLLSFLRTRFDFTGGNLLEFPYDWRVSIRASAMTLAERIRQGLSEWRERSGNERAKVVFVAHSMGGLIARYYADVLEGAEVTRALITIGTPYRGSVNAAVTLARGVAPALGSLADPLTRLSRSLPSIHQLLPRYRCLLGSEGIRVGLDSELLPGVDPRLAAGAARLHADLEDAAPPMYAVHAFGGYRQPTRQSVRLTVEGLTAVHDLDGHDHRGDGTVPRFSCFPPAWTDDTAVRFFAQRHSSLQNEPALLNQIEAILTARDPREFLDSRVELAVDLPEIAPGLVAPVVVETEDDRLSLAASAENVETGEKLPHAPLRGNGDGSYHGSITFSEAGTWRVTLRDATPANRVHPVTDLVLTTVGNDQLK